MNEWAELDRALDAMASSGSAEVREDGQWLAELAGLRCELRAEGKNPLVHLWSEERNLTRRILRVREQSQDRIVLEVQRFGRTKPGRLEFLRTDSPRATARVSREQFRARFERFLTERFPDAVVDSLSAAPDLEHSFSGLYVRGRIRGNAHFWVARLARRGWVGQMVVAVPPVEWGRAHLAKSRDGKPRTGRRIRAIGLTKSGKKFIGNVLPRHSKVVKAMMRALDGREQETMSRLWRKLRAGDIMKFVSEITHEDVES